MNFIQYRKFNISTVNMIQALTKQPTVDNILLEDLHYTVLDYNWVFYRDSMELAELHEIDERIPPKEYVAYRPERMTQKKIRSTQKKKTEYSASRSKKIMTMAPVK